jgi:hypothetical protein
MDDNTLLLHEILTRLREMQSQQFGGKNVATIENLRGKVDSLFDRIEANYRPWLLFRGYYLRELRAVIKGSLDQLEVHWEHFHDSGDARKLIDFLIDYARGNLRMPFQGFFLSGLHTWLIQNQQIFRDTIGTTAPQL